MSTTSYPENPRCVSVVARRVSETQIGQEEAHIISTLGTRSGHKCAGGKNDDAKMAAEENERQIELQRLPRLIR